MSAELIKPTPPVPTPGAKKPKRLWFKRNAIQIPPRPRLLRTDSYSAWKSKEDLLEQASGKEP